MDKEVRVLIVEDLPSDAELAKRELKTVLNNFTTKTVETEPTYIEALEEFKPDLIISDYQMPVFNGLAALRIREEKYPLIPFIILTGSKNEDTAVVCLQAGADDYVIKEHIKRLGQAVLRSIEKKKNEAIRKKAEEENIKLSAAVTQSPSVIAITDVQGNLEYVNPKFTEQTGYTIQEAKGLNPKVLKFGNQPEEIYAELWKTISKGKEWHGEFHNKKKNGDGFWEAASISPIINDQGEIINYLKVAEDITIRKLAVEKLAKSEEKLRGLTKYMDAKFEEEKKRIGKEIHDGIGQLLTGLKMDLQWIIKKWPQEVKELNNKFMSMNDIIDNGVKEVQKLSIQLRPKMLDELGLLETIKTEAEKFEQRTGINCDVQFKPDNFEVEYDRSTTLYRILMELLTNIYRYADASNIEIKLEMNNIGYLFTVVDNGIGITNDQIEDKTSFGLMTITERVNKWNGKFSISGEHKKGTIVKISLPF